MTVLLVAAGAALGAPLRYVMAHVLDGRFRSAPRNALGLDQSGLHWGTMLVNVVGSFLLGLFSGLGLSGGQCQGSTQIGGSIDLFSSSIACHNP